MIGSSEIYRDERGPFDIIGDVHGCLGELKELLRRLGYVESEGSYCHPLERIAVFLGDITDRGPDSLGTIELVAEMVEKGHALYTPGNHCNKLYRYLKGNPVRVDNGLEYTVEEFKTLAEKRGKDEAAKVAERFIRLVDGAPPYLILDEGRLVVAHAGIREDMIGDVSRRIQDFCLYGDVTGEKHEDGRPVRRDWAREYSGRCLIVYGHTVVRKPRVLNNTINIDQGAVFGGRLTAFRYPELEVVSVDSSMPKGDIEKNPLFLHEHLLEGAEDISTLHIYDSGMPDFHIYDSSIPDLRIHDSSIPD